LTHDTFSEVRSPVHGSVYMSTHACTKHACTKHACPNSLNRIKKVFLCVFLLFQFHAYQFYFVVCVSLRWFGAPLCTHCAGTLRWFGGRYAGLVYPTHKYLQHILNAFAHIHEHFMLLHTPAFVVTYIIYIYMYVYKCMSFCDIYIYIYIYIYVCLSFCEISRSHQGPHRRGTGE
jgi:hypothetical protein